MWPLPVLEVNCSERKEEGKRPLCKSTIKRHASPTEPKHQHHALYKQQHGGAAERRKHGSCSCIRNHPLIFLNSKNYISHDSRAGELILNDLEFLSVSGC